MAKNDICEICGSNNYVRRYGKTNQLLCSKHYKQMYNHGEIFDNSPKTYYERNEILIKNDHAEIIILNNKYNIKGKCLISLDKIDLVKDIKWRINSGGYVQGLTKEGIEIGIHQLIMSDIIKGDIPHDKEVDHKNRKRLDNRNSNLRIVTRVQNGENKGLLKSNKSGTTGVCWKKGKNRWRAYIWVNKKMIELGLYKNINDAIRVRKEAEEKYFGEYACKQEEVVINE